MFSRIARLFKAIWQPEYACRIGAAPLHSFYYAGTGGALPWPLCENGAAVSFQAPKIPIVSGNVLGCVSLAEHGAGITQSYDFVVADRIKSGRLVEVLPFMRGCGRAFSLIYPPHPHLPRAARALIDFLVVDSTLRQSALVKTNGQIHRK